MRLRAPTAEQIRDGRLGRLFGPRLRDPKLWLRRRRSMAVGAALGVFFGFLIPLGQFLLSGAAAILLRANVPMAMASTLVSNPLTFGPIYVAAYQLGSWLLGSTPSADEMAGALALAHAPTDQDWLGWLASVGQPLLLGLLLFAIAGATSAYWGVRWFWALNVLRKKRGRRQRSAARRLSSPDLQRVHPAELVSEAIAEPAANARDNN